MDYDNEARKMNIDEEGIKYAQAHNKKMSSGKKAALIIGCVLAGIVLIGIAINFFGNAILHNILGINFAEEEVDYGDSAGDYVSIIHIEGTITDGDGYFFGDESYNHDFTLNAIDSAMNSTSNRGILLIVDSPGGGVYESDEVYLALKEYKEKTKKPVYAYMKSMAASGGYYISAAADKIAANRNCWTGSIGVTVGTFYDISGLLKKYGVDTVTIDSGSNKSMGSSVEPMSREQERIFQSLVDEAYDQFTDIVADSRGLGIKRTKKLADGRIYSAAQAKRVDLIDEVMTYEEAVELMKKDNELKGCDFRDLKPPAESLWDEVMGVIFKAEKKANGDVQAILEAINEDRGFPISYISTVLE